MSICVTPRFCCWCAAPLAYQADIVGESPRLFRVACGSCGLGTYGSTDDGERAACITHPSQRHPPDVEVTSTARGARPVVLVEVATPSRLRIPTARVPHDVLEIVDRVSSLVGYLYRVTDTEIVIIAHSAVVALEDLRRRLDEHGIELRQVGAEAGLEGGAA